MKEAISKLNKVRISARKFRLVADTVRGLSVAKSLTLLKFCNKKSAPLLSKLIKSAVSNWKNHNQDVASDSSDLFIRVLKVDGSGMLKRLMPAAQGRGCRIRKRFCSVTVVVNKAVV